MLERKVAATPMIGWGGPIADRHVRFVFSNEPVERLATLGDRRDHRRESLSLQGRRCRLDAEVALRMNRDPCESCGVQALKRRE